MPPFKSRIGWIRAMRRGTLPLFGAVALLTSVWLHRADASVRPEDSKRIGRPLLVPAPGEKLVESAVRFAFQTPAGLEKPVLVLSRQAFDPSSWTELPSGSDFVLKDAADAAVSLASTEINVVADTPLWWAVAARRPAHGPAARERSAVFHGSTQVHEPGGAVALPARRPGRGRSTLASWRRIRPRRTARARCRAFVCRPDTTSRRPRASLHSGGADGSTPPRRSDRLGSARCLPGPVRATPDRRRGARRITAAGGAVFSYIPDQAYLVRMTAAARVQLEARAAWRGSATTSPPSR